MQGAWRGKVFADLRDAGCHSWFRCLFWRQFEIPEAKRGLFFILKASN